MQMVSFGHSTKLTRVGVCFSQMLNKVPKGGNLKVEHVVSFLEKSYPYVEVSSILGSDSAYDKNRKVRSTAAVDSPAPSMGVLFVSGVASCHRFSVKPGTVAELKMPLLLLKCIYCFNEV